MGRIRDALVIGARTVARVPIPSAITTHALREARMALPPGGVQKRHAVDVEMVGRTRCVWLDRHHADQGVIVHLHGGAYTSGPFAADWNWLSHQVDKHGCAGVMVDYRTAPDHVHPVAIDDAHAVVEALAERGDLKAPWVLSGHHAGGGLAMVLARRLADQMSIAQPAALIVVCPWLDLELSNSGLSETGQHDPVHERRIMREAARAYAGRTPLDDPELSPINGSLEGLPPIHLSVGTRDLFLSDVRVAKLQLEENEAELKYRELNGRLGLRLWARRGEDMQRLVSEHADLIRRAFRGN